MSPFAATRTGSTTSRSLPALLTTRETAELLRVDPRTIDRWAAEERLHPVRLGRRTIRYRADELLDLIDPKPGHEARLGDQP